MALMQCPECGGKVSDKASNCPHCGRLAITEITILGVEDTHE